MRRRTLLARLGAITAAGAIAGCLDDAAEDPPGAEDDGDDEYEEDAETDEDETDEDEADDADEKPSIVDRRIETVGTESASEGEELTVKSEATVSIEDDAVEIEGTLEAPTPCYEAIFADVSLEDGHLTVTVDLEEDEEAEACIQVISEIAYEATIFFEKGVPESVTVIHVDEGGTDTAAETER